MTKEIFDIVWIQLIDAVHERPASLVKQFDFARFELRIQLFNLHSNTYAPVRAMLVGEKELALQPGEVRTDLGLFNFPRF